MPTPKVALNFAFKLGNKSKHEDMIMNVKAFATTMIEEILGGECDLPEIAVKTIRNENRAILAMPKAYADAINRFAPNGRATMPDGPEGDTVLTVSPATKESTDSVGDDGMEATWWAHADTDIALGIPLHILQEAIDHHFHRHGFWLTEPSKPVLDKETGMATNILHA